MVKEKAATFIEGNRESAQQEQIHVCQQKQKGTPNRKEAVSERQRESKSNFWI